jgi:UPF0716 protein FxsA
MRRFLLVVAVLVTVPIIEIAVLIAIGQVIGLGWTLLLMLSTSALGGWLLRREGARAWLAFQEDLAQRRPPGNTATDGLIVLIGGIFMLVPGFVSDVIGLFFLLRPTRALARVFVLRTVVPRLSPVAATSLFGPRRIRVRFGDPRPPGPGAGGGPGSPPDGGETIDGEVVG